jgi:hypothetical protein
LDDSFGRIVLQLIFIRVCSNKGVVFVFVDILLGTAPFLSDSRDDGAVLSLSFESLYIKMECCFVVG